MSAFDAVKIKAIGLIQLKATEIKCIMSAAVRNEMRDNPRGG
jgi:hypothetical protein